MVLTGESEPPDPRRGYQEEGEAFVAKQGYEKAMADDGNSAKQTRIPGPEE
jgi:hypothetical protein